MSFLQMMISSYLAYEAHHHPLIKNEDYHAHEGDLCYGCGLLLHESSVVYHCTYLGTNAEKNDCANFFIHKTCAHLPTDLKHPVHQHWVELATRPVSHTIYTRDKCDVCGIKLKWFTYFCRNCNDGFQSCLTCAIPINKISIHAPYHRHKLTFLASLATFRCDVCHELGTDFSYMCYTCPFWIHLKCHNLPALLESDFHHKHPLRLAYSLPENYRRFQQSCRICKTVLHVPSDWLYYCPDCRFFAHINCATSPAPMGWNRQQYSIPKRLADLVHLPVPESSSLLQHCIKDRSILWSDDAVVTPPDYINHWSHEHQLLLKNTSIVSTNCEEEISPICNGCTESISSKDGAFYECRECDYILHRYCAQFPEEMQHDPGLGGKLVAIQPRVHDIWSCARCKGFRNGTQIRCTYEVGWKKKTITVKLDSGCALLPERIRHKAHQYETHSDYFVLTPCESVHCICSACSKNISWGEAFYMYLGDECDDRIHIECALKPLRVTHRWDCHPLDLKTSAEEVLDHPHEFQCEFCSEEIDTNYWFYHCSVCDLSFHFKGCIDQFPYSNVKFGATNIRLDAHQHGLTFVLNKHKRRPCHRCDKDTYGKPVLECTPCKFVQHSQPELCS